LMGVWGAVLKVLKKGGKIFGNVARRIASRVRARRSKRKNKKALAARNKQIAAINKRNAVIARMRALQEVKRKKDQQKKMVMAVGIPAAVIAATML